MTDVRILAGSLVLADADGDEQKAQAVLDRVAAGEVTTVAFVVALARLAGEALQLAAGERWQDELNAALLALDLDLEETEA